MPKLTLENIVSGFKSLVGINSNFDKIEEAIEKTLSRDGTEPNAMSADIDMNSHKLINVAPGTSPTDAINKSQLDNLDVSAETLALIAQRVAVLLDEGVVPVDPIVISGLSSLDVTFGVGGVSSAYTAIGGDGSAFSWSLSGAPAGVTINATTGIITIGTSVPVGVSSFSVIATDAGLNTGSRVVTLNVNYTSLSLTPPQFLLPAQVGVTYTSGTFTLAGASGTYQDPTITAGSLPQGINFSRTTSTTWVLTGTPVDTGTEPRTYNFIATWTSSDGQVRSYTGALPVQKGVVTVDPLVVTAPQTASLYEWTVGVEISPQIELTVTGGVQPYTYLILEPRVPGLVSIFDSNFFGGVPTTYGNYLQSIRVSSQDGQVQTITLPDISVSPRALTLTAAALPQATEGVAYPTNVLFTASGGTTSAFTLEEDAGGTVLSTVGLTLTASSGAASNRTWYLTGTITAATAGTYSLRLKLTDTNADFGSVTYITVTLTVVAAVSENLPPSETQAPQNIAFTEGTFGALAIDATTGTQTVTAGTVIVNGVSRTVGWSDGNGPIWSDPESDPFTIATTYTGALPPGVRIDPYYDIDQIVVGAIFIYNGSGAVTVNTTNNTVRFVAEYTPPTPPPGGGGGDPTEADASWTRRTTYSSTNRILGKVRFDSIDEINPASSSQYPQLLKETSSGNGYQAGNWAHDPSIKVSGYGSLRMNLGATSQSPTWGQYIDPVDRTAFYTGSSNNEYYLQFAWRPSEHWVKHYHKTASSSTGQKIVICYRPNQSFSSYHLVLNHHRQWGTLSGYIGASGPQVWGTGAIGRRNPLNSSDTRLYVNNAIDSGSPASPSITNIDDVHERFGPDYSSAGTGVESGWVSDSHLRTTYVSTAIVDSGTITFEPDQWYVFLVRLKFNTPGAQDSIVQVWASELGAQPKLIISTNQANFFQSSTGTGSHTGFQLTTYLSDKQDEPTSTLSPYVWYDEVITSRDPIKFPRYGTGADWDIPAGDLTTFYPFQAT